MAFIQSFIDRIRTAKEGRDVRSSLADGIDAINKETESTTNRQVNLDATFEQLIINAGESNAEIVAARHDNSNGQTYDTLPKRLDATSAQLATKASQNQVDILNSNFISPLYFGEKDNLNNTQIIQEALNSLNDGDTFILPYGNWLVTNIIIPNKSRIVLLFYGTLKAISGGNPDYLVATYNYVNNINQAGQPIRKLINPKIDGSGIVTNGLVIQTWDTIIDSPHIYSCENAIKITAQTLNGTDFTSSTLVNITINNPNITSNTGKGIWIKDTARNRITDYNIIGGFIRNNGGFAIDADSCAGALIEGVHTYSNSRSLNIKIASLALRIKSCYFEESDSIYFGAFNSNIFVSLIANTIKGSVLSKYTNTYSGIKSVGNTFMTLNGRFRSEWANLHFIMSTGDSFETDAPFLNTDTSNIGNGSAPNKAYAVGCVSTLLQNKLIQGVQKNNITSTIDI